MPGKRSLLRKMKSQSSVGGGGGLQRSGSAVGQLAMGSAFMLSSVDEEGGRRDNEFVCDSDNDDEDVFGADVQPSLRRRGAIQKTNNRRSSEPNISLQSSLNANKPLKQIGRGLTQAKGDAALPITRNSTRILSLRGESNSFSSFLVKDNVSLARYLDELPPEKSLQLVNQRLDVEVEGVYDRFTPLGYAISENNPEMVRTLLSHGADINGKPNVLKYDENHHLSEIESPLHFAALFMCEPAILGHLVEYGADVDSPQQKLHCSVIRYIAGCPDKAIIEKLVGVLAVNDHADRDLVAALHLSTTNQNEEAVQVLLGTEVNINARQSCKTALLLACKTDNARILKLLLQTGSRVNDCDQWNRAPLHFAVKHCSEENIRLLLDAGADVNAQDRSNRSILNYLFARSGNKLLTKRPTEEPGTIVGLLLEASDTNLHVRNPNEFLEALHAVLSSDSDERLILKFIHKNSSFMLPDHRAELFLHTAIRHKKKLVMEWLLKNVSKVQDSDIDRGWMAIHHAVATKDREMIQAVLDHGADFNASAKQGITPICLMIRFGLFSLVEEYINKGCAVDGTIRLSGLLLIPCEEGDPPLPIELYNPKDAQDGLTQAKRNKRQLTLVELAVYMDQYRLAYALFQAGAPLVPKPSAKSSGASLEVLKNLIDTKLKASGKEQLDYLQKLRGCLESAHGATSANGNGLVEAVAKLDIHS